MNKNTFIHLASCAIMCMLALTIIIIVPQNKLTEPEKFTEIDPLSHEQRVWMYALEWCESNGVKTAINPKDKDNTPSYYSWQFKPSTFRYYGEKYKVLPTYMDDTDILSEMTDYKTQSAIIEQMILHRDEINWSQQFPVCVSKLGYPPKLSTTTTKAI